MYCNVIVNKKGTVNLNISSTVNEKESISTTSNSNLQYKINIKNNGNVVSYDNVITTTLPNGFKYVDGSATNGGYFNESTNTITWTLARIDDNSNVVLKYEAYAPNGLSGLKEYVSDASISSLNAPNKVDSNKTTVRLMMNPKTSAPLYGIGITLIIMWGVAFYLYFEKRKKEVLQYGVVNKK